MEQLLFTTNSLLESFLSNAAYDFLKGLYNKIRNKKSEVQLLIKPEIYLQPIDKPIYSAASKRIIAVIDLLNEGRTEHNTLNYSHIAELMGMKNVYAFETMLANEAGPDFEYMEKFACTFNINLEWLKHGKDYPFSHACNNEYMYLENALPFIAEYNPNRIFFVRTLSEESVCCVVLTKSDYDFRILHFHSNWRISSKTGNTGQAQTTSIYHSMRCLKRGSYEEQQTCEKNIHDLPSYATVSGIELANTQNMNDLIDGKKHPSFLCQRSDTCFNSLWHEDLSDLNHNTLSAEEYLNIYGQEFLDAQSVIRYKLSKQ